MKEFNFYDDLKISELVDDVINSESRSKDSIVSSDQTKFLSLYYASKSFKLDCSQEKYMMNLWDEIQRGIEFPKNLSFFYSSIGTAWLLDFVSMAENTNLSSFNEPFDDFIKKILFDDHFKWKDVELIRGVVGLAIYIYQRPEDGLKKSFFKYLLENINVNKNDSLCYTPKLSSFYVKEGGLESNQINLGLSHGLPGLISVLLKYKDMPSYNSVVKKIIFDLTNLLIKEIQEHDKVGSFFGKDSKTKIKTGISWCYGDLSNSLVILRVAEYLGSSYFMNIAESILSHILIRDDRFDFRCNSFCHGRLGVALILKILMRKSVNKKLKKEMLGYYNELMNDIYSMVLKYGGKSFWKYNFFSQDFENENDIFTGSSSCLISLSILLSDNFKSPDIFLLE